jgi:exodeoxyribonuclease V gamma subunit
MTIFYDHSLHLPDLASSLQGKIDLEQKQNPLKAPIIVVPNPNIERWLKINLPKISKAKMSVNVRYTFLEKIFEEVLLGTDQYLSKELLYHQTEVERLIFQYLLKKKTNPSFAFLGKYLESVHRVFFLSTKLANYFKDYELNRSSWIFDWAREKKINLPKLNDSRIPEKGETSEYFNFQKEIYSDLFLNPDVKKSTLSQFLIRATEIKDRSLEFTSIHLFCLANLSDTYLHVLDHLSKFNKLDIHFYQFHTGQKELIFENPNETSIMWHFPQTSLAKSLAKLSKEQNFKMAPEATVRQIPIGLQSLRDFMQGKKSKEIPKFLADLGSTEDGSLRFWNAPSVYREVEAVAHDILRKMNAERDLKEGLSLLDFSILVTDIKEYRAAIEWVFDGGILTETNLDNKPTLKRQKIPYSLVDLKASEASPLYRALATFFDLCSPSGFKLAQLQVLLQNPLLYRDKARAVEDADSFAFVLQNLGVAYEDQNPRLGDDPFQISNGIRRAILSNIISEESATLNFDFAYAHYEEEESIIRLTEIWLRILESRKKALSFLATGIWNEASLIQLRTAVENLFPDSEIESEIRNQFYEFWEHLSFWEGTQLNGADALDILKQITEQVFNGISTKKGDYLTGGVTFSLLQPMRPLPFKHVYILGLGEGKFPGSIDRSKLNLRQEFPEDWDLDRRQIQESLLWESLFSATESLTLSYVGKNTKEDKVFEPSSSLFAIMEGLGVKQALEIPLVSYSDKYTHSTEAMRAGLVSYDYARIWFNEKIEKPSILKDFQDKELLASEVERNQGSIKIHSRELTQFLKDPMDTFLRKKLGIYIDRDLETETEEIFHLDAINRSRLQKEVYRSIFEKLATSKEIWNRKKIESILDPIITSEIKQAKFPNSIYAKVERERILDHFEGKAELFQNWQSLLAGATYYRYLSFGNTGLSPETCLKLPALTFKKIPEVVLFHECEHIFVKENKYYYIYTKSLEATPNSYSDFKDYFDYFGKLAEPFLVWNLFAKAGLHLEILTTNQKKEKNDFEERLLFASKDDRKNADAYLEKLIHCYSQDEPTFFSRITYLNFYIDHFKPTKTNPALPFEKDTLLAMKNEWLQYQEDFIDLAYSTLTSASKLYPRTEEFLRTPNIEFANSFYAPMSLWRENENTI